MRLQPIHRARRFMRSLVAAAPSEADSQWVKRYLNEAELRAFARLAPGDRSHSIGVAKKVAANLDRLGSQTGRTDSTGTDSTGTDSPGGDSDWVVAAALLHDIGKSVPGLGTYGRVVATLCGAVVGDEMADHWIEKSGMTRRIGLYLRYPELGVPILELAGSDPRVVAWSAQHHRPPEEWEVPIDVGELLSAADDGRL